MIAQVDSISSAIQSAYGAMPLVQCSSGHFNRLSKHKGSQVLSAIGLCIKSDLTIIDCPDNIIAKEGCNSDLFYLPF